MTASPFLLILIFPVFLCCHIAINEVVTNFYKFDTNDEQYDFVEIAAVDCYAAPPLQPYVLLFIQLNYGHENLPLIVQYISLYHQSFKVQVRLKTFDRFITYGNLPHETSRTNFVAPEKQNVPYSWVLKSNYKSKSIGATTSPALGLNFAIVLIKTDQGSRNKDGSSAFLSNIRYIISDKHARKERVILDKNKIDFIVKYAEDAMIVVGDEQTVHPMADLLSEKTKKPILLHNLREQSTQSVNVCQTKYILARPTPGAENICTGREISVKGGNEPTTAASDVQSGITVAPNNEENNNAEIEIIDVDNENDRSNKRKQPAGEDSCPVPSKKFTPWYDRVAPWVDVERILKRSGFLTTPYQFKTIKEHASWMEVVNSETGQIIQVTDFTKDIAIRCKYCHRYRIEKHYCVDDSADHTTHDKGSRCNSLNAFANLRGYKDVQRILPKMKDHENSPQHKQSVEYAETVIQNVMDGLNPETNKDPTCNMMKLVYEEIRSNVPFARHPNFVELLKSTGSDMGLLHFSRISAKNMATSISDTLHKDFINFLKKEQPPMSLITDTSTDSSGRNIILIYFRVFYQEWPQIYFYRAVQLKSETAEAIMKQLEQLFKDDGITDIVKNHLIGVATDGAATMTGEYTGLKARLRTFSNNPLLVHQHCLSHRLELVSNNAFSAVVLADNINLKKNLTTAINGIANFFGTRSVKRKSILIETCEDMRIEVYTLRRIFDIRWSATQAAALQSVIQMYGCTWRTYKKLAGIDDDTLAETKSTASDYLEIMNDINFFAAISFFEDYFDILKKYSLSYQKASGVMIGQKEKYFKLRESVQQLADNDGPFLSSGIQRISCIVGRVTPTAEVHWGEACRPFIIDNSKRINDDVTLYLDRKRNPIADIDFGSEFVAHTTTITWPSLIAYRTTFISSVIESLNSYYTGNNLEDFECLNVQTSITVDGRDINLNDGCDERLKELAQRLKVESPNIAKQYTDLLKDVLFQLGETEFTNWMKFAPEIFYSKLINFAENDDIIEVSKELKRFLASALTVPIGSSDAERGFSILFHSLDKRRMSLEIETIDSILRLRLNGPALKDFFCFKFIQDWKAQGGLSSDAQQPRGKDQGPRSNAKKPETDENDDPIFSTLNHAFVKEKFESRHQIFVPNINEMF